MEKDTQKLDEVNTSELKENLEKLELIYEEYSYRKHLENKLEEVKSNFVVPKDNQEIKNLDKEMKELKEEYKDDFSNKAYERSILNLIFKYFDLYENQSLIKTLEEEKKKLEKDIKSLD